MLIHIEIATFDSEPLCFKFAVCLDTNLFEIVDYTSKVLKVVPSEITCFSKPRPFDAGNQLDVKKTLIVNGIYEDNKIIYIDTSKAHVTTSGLHLARAYDNEHVVIVVSTSN